MKKALVEWLQFIIDVIEPPHTKEKGPVVPMKSVWDKYTNDDGSVILCLHWEEDCKKNPMGENI